jgi:hypothetical protein
VNLENLRYLTLISVIIYFIFEFLDRKTVKDEREELIRLKTYELMQKLTMWSLTALALSFVFFPEMPAMLPVMILIFASMYGEIAGKLYFRWKY